ncbi:MAG: glycosyltransferase [Bacteroidales bacterium]|nr:glycosyltransferase [Bacteroidales bacterium]
MKSDKYTILFLSTWFPSEIFPFRGDFVKRHAKAVSLYSKVVSFHVIKDKNLTTKYNLTEHSENNYHELIYYFNSKWFSKLSYLFYYFKGFNYIRKKYGNPDLIHANVLYPIGIVAYILSSIYKIPYVFTEHWTGFLNNTFKGFSRFNKSIYCYIGKKAKYIIPVTHNLKDSMIESGINGNYDVIPNVVETDIFKWGDVANQGKKQILHVSHIRDDHKNISGILRVVSKLSKTRKDFVLSIIHSEGNEKIIELAHSLNLIGSFVKFLGKKDYSEVAQYMAQSAFLVLFSNYENLPCVIVEALASGLPVLSTDVGGIHEHLDLEKGILIKKGDENALLEKMNYLLDHHNDYDKKALRNYAVSNFSYEKIGQEYSNIYRTVLND